MQQIISTVKFALFNGNSFEKKKNEAKIISLNLFLEKDFPTKNTQNPLYLFNPNIET